MSPPPKLAATVVLLRDSGRPQPETFLVRRHGRSGFMAGATVFPGGKVDPLDYEAATTGRSDADSCRSLGVDDAAQARALYVAAVRELHEEAHVVLARDARGALPEPDQVRALNEALDDLRDGHRLAASAVHDLWRSHGLTPALDLVAPFAWWVTPLAEPRRFDTRFFVAVQPRGQGASMDGHETTAETWATAADGVQAHGAGEALYLPPPTLHTLQRLAALPGDASSVWRQLRDAGPGPKIQPHFVADTADGPVIALPDDPLHPAPLGDPALRNRFVLRDGRFMRETQGDVLI